MKIGFARVDNCDNDVTNNPIHVGWPLLSRITVKGFGPGGDDTRLRKVDFVKIYSD